MTLPRCRGSSWREIQQEGSPIELPTHRVSQESNLGLLSLRRLEVRTRRAIPTARAMVDGLRELDDNYPELRWQHLSFFPEPQGQGSFLSIEDTSTTFEPR